jgi:hypothetical protein
LGITTTVTSFAESGEVLFTREVYQLIGDHMKSFLDSPIIEEVSKVKLNDNSRPLYRMTPQALKGRRFHSSEREFGTLGSVGSSGGDLAWGAQLDKISSKLHQRWIIPYEELRYHSYSSGSSPFLSFLLFFYSFFSFLFFLCV